MTEELSYSSYILNDANMANYLKYKLVSNNNDVRNDNNKNLKRERNEKREQTDKREKPLAFFPRENDSLFWCYYIIKNGDLSYEMINVKNVLVERQHKINYVNKIRENKPTLKIYRFDTLTNIENNLANDNRMNLSTFMSLCAIDNLNIVYVNKKTYFELLLSDDKPTYIIRNMEDNRYNKKYGYELASISSLDEIRSNLYKIENIDKPIKAPSAYKVQDLHEIAEKLAIDINDKLTGKKLSKGDLYELISQYLH